MGDRREQRRWERELQRELDALPTYEGDTPDGGAVTPIGRSLPRPPRESRRERRRRETADPLRHRASGAGPERRRTFVTVGVTFAVIAAVMFASPVAQPIRSLVGWDGDRGDDTSYAFLGVNSLSGDPITWSSCDPIRFVVNDEGAPDGWEGDLDSAMAAVSDATGLELVIEGGTDDRPGGDRLGPRGQADPVLVSWATPEEVPDLDGDTIGLAGPRGRNGVYETGTVTFDGPQFQQLERSGGDRLGRAIMMHELAHLVGLDHVDDEAQLMYPTTTFQTSFGNGDLEGLRILGEGTCR